MNTEITEAVANAIAAASDYELPANLCRKYAKAAIEALSANTVAPIPMLLFCPNCGQAHIDAPDERTPDWTNPPHKSHLCHDCGCIWRPADVPTEGVASIKTVGKADTWTPERGNAIADRLERTTPSKPDGLTKQIALRVSERASEHIHGAFDWDGVPDSAWEELTVALYEIAEDEARAALSPDGDDHE